MRLGGAAEDKQVELRSQLLRTVYVDRIAHVARQARHRPTKVYVGNRELVGDSKRENFSIILAQDFRLRSDWGAINLFQW